MKTLKKYLTTPKLILGLILVVGAGLRFYNYPQRITLHQDQARDLIIANFAITHHILPLLGPPSSAGNFSFGPLYYWLIILFKLILPSSLFSPWLGFTLLSLLSVYLFYLIGNHLKSENLGLILASLAAVSTSEVTNSPDLLNPALVSFFITLAIFSLVKFMSQPKRRWAILSGLSLGISLNLHLEALTSLSLILLTPIFYRSSKVRWIIGSLIGFMISFLPLIYFDFVYQGLWIKSIFNYLLVGQTKFNSSVSLGAELFEFWPSQFGQVISGNALAGYFVFSLIIILLIVGFLKFKTVFKQPGFLILSSAFLVQAVSLHLYKGPRLPMYLLVFNPFVIFLAAWAIWLMLKIKLIKHLAWVVLGLILLVSLQADYQIISHPETTSQITKIENIHQQLLSKNQGPFQMYSFDSSNGLSLPIFYLLDKEHKISDQGFKIGACDHHYSLNPTTFEDTENCSLDQTSLAQQESYQILDLNTDFDHFTKYYPVQIDSKQIFNWLYSYYPEAKIN